MTGTYQELLTHARILLDFIQTLYFWQKKAQLDKSPPKAVILAKI